MLFLWIAFGSGKCFACKVVRSWKSRNPKEEVYLETCQHCLWDFLFGPATKCCHNVVTCCVAKSHFSYDLPEVQGILTKYNLWMQLSYRQSRAVTFVEMSAPRCRMGHMVVPKLDEHLQSFLICDVDDVVSRSIWSLCIWPASLPTLAICINSRSSTNAWEVLYEFRCYKRTLPDEPRPEGRLRKLHPFVSLDLKSWNDVMAVVAVVAVRVVCEALFPKSVVNCFSVICLSSYPTISLVHCQPVCHLRHSKWSFKASRKNDT